MEEYDLYLAKFSHKNKIFLLSPLTYLAPVHTYTTVRAMYIPHVHTTPTYKF